MCFPFFLLAQVIFRNETLQMSGMAMNFFLFSYFMNLPKKKEWKKRKKNPPYVDISVQYGELLFATYFFIYFSDIKSGVLRMLKRPSCRCV